jgi:hypothetical protein
MFSQPAVFANPGATPRTLRVLALLPVKQVTMIRAIQHAFEWSIGLLKGLARRAHLPQLNRVAAEATGRLDVRASGCCVQSVPGELPCQ